MTGEIISFEAPRIIGRYRTEQTSPEESELLLVARDALLFISELGQDYRFHSVLARPLPREPFKGQKRPPCTRYAEVEWVGACWLPHELKAPCPDVLYEDQGKCDSPAFSARPPPSSLGP